MRRLLVIAGFLSILLGSIWVLHGAGFLQGSFMSNDPTWLWIGMVVVVLGLILLGFGIRPSSKKRVEPPITGSRTA